MVPLSFSNKPSCENAKKNDTLLSLHIEQFWTEGAKHNWAFRIHNVIKKTLIHENWSTVVKNSNN